MPMQSLAFVSYMLTVQLSLGYNDSNSSTESVVKVLEKDAINVSFDAFSAADIQSENTVHCRYTSARQNDRDNRLTTFSDVFVTFRQNVSHYYTPRFFPTVRIRNCVAYEMNNSVTD